ncbi:MAG: argininosuccinate lyase [Eggerthia catenaformis]|uniref:argininosuccinate lyase n=1 Tax=Eggerthia catenaformis TaxID=31973 RepID=UPI003F9EC5D7
MTKLWTGRTTGQTDPLADDFNSSLYFDKRMYRQDIEGSIAHAAMLMKQKIIPKESGIKIQKELRNILSELDLGELEFDEYCEDIHMFIEQLLTSRIGEEGKMLHTARSRNDQVALDLRMYLKEECDQIISLLKEFIGVLADKSEAHKEIIMPGYTHLQRAQPILFAHHLLAYAQMLLRDVSRLEDSKKRMNVSPIGSCALAGTTYHIDRYFEAALLGFDDISMNSLDGVSDRDFAVEMLSDLSLIMTHLSRFAEEFILWSSWEFQFIEADDQYTTGSSIMPQKKNPDMAELIRGKTGRVYGDLMSLLTVLKGLPLAYNKDMQEDKEPIFDSCDTVKMCLKVFIPMIKTMKVNKKNMHYAAQKGFINATDVADYLTKKGVPFRDAYKISGQLVALCISKDCILEELSLSEYQSYSALIKEDIYEAISLRNCVIKRISEGGTSISSIDTQIQWIRKKL